jgi:hypothetical protein
MKQKINQQSQSINQPRRQGRKQAAIQSINQPRRQGRKQAAIQSINQSTIQRLILILEE